MTGQGIHTNAWPILLASGLRIISITVRFRVKRDYRSTILVSVSSLISQLGWRTLSDRRRNSRLSLMYKSLHGLTGISTTFSSSFQAYPFSWWRRILCFLFSYRSLQVLLLSSYHCWLECPSGICEVLSLHLFVLLCHTFQLDPTLIPAVMGGNAWPTFAKEAKG